MESGAYDYLIKSELNSEKLERCIRYSLERASSIQALKANERRYRSIFEKSKDVVFTATPNFEILDINYAATELLDYELEEFQGTDLFSLFKGENERIYFSDILNEIGEFYDYEVDLVSKNSDIKNCIISASVEINNNGEKYIQGIIHDNTSRKKSRKVCPPNRKNGRNKQAGSYSGPRGKKPVEQYQSFDRTIAATRFPRRMR